MIRATSIGCITPGIVQKTRRSHSKEQLRNQQDRHKDHANALHVDQQRPRQERSQKLYARRRSQNAVLELLRRSSFLDEIEHGDRTGKQEMGLLVPADWRKRGWDLREVTI